MLKANAFSYSSKKISLFMLDLCKHINDVENFQADIMTFFSK